MSYRVLLNVLMFISATMFPWWVVLTLGLVGLVMIQNFYEIIFFGFLLDIFYGIPGDTVFHGAIFTLIAAGLYILGTWFTSKLVFYNW